MRDIKSNVDAVKSIDPATYNSNQTGTGVDLQGYEAAMAVIQSGALTDGTHTPKMQESDDDSTYTDVGATDLEMLHITPPTVNARQCHVIGVATHHVAAGDRSHATTAPADKSS